ncbi:thioredoxin family protein [Paenibacillus sp. MER TA 81-3]|uniref:thioredoxin family protein n=1 Tax=Paenibacillus sp. MER TA 81-3 TaxID=2939573 RepID=UPI00203C47F4|nr:thioredoxin family protein [Paenibacillus sp. MER TA 81-3]MCM3341383.1 thioredoxin family protein [Paenibacillus sp. MER TA 81-3]
MSKNVAGVLGKGISPQAFIDSMQKNKEAFLSWYEQFEWANEEDKAYFESLQFRDDIRCLILAADWCGDVVRNVPVVFRALETAQMQTEVLIMEQFPDVMDEFLTMGGRSVPIVIFADTGGHVLGQWGPRPSDVQAHMVAFKQANPDREASDYQDKLQVVRQQMMKQYGESAAYHARVVSELRELLSAL